MLSNVNWDAMTTEKEVMEVLAPFKKKELIEIAESMGIRVYSNFTKAILKDRIYQLKVGTRMRMYYFGQIKEKSRN